MMTEKYSSFSSSFCVFGESFYVAQAKDCPVKSNPLLLPLWGSGRGRGFMRGFAPRKCPRGGELVIFTMSNPLLSPTLSRKWGSGACN